MLSFGRSRGFLSHLVPVDVIESIEEHLHDLLDLGQGELDICVAQQPCQVMLTEVKHQVDVAFVSVELSGWRREGRRVRAPFNRRYTQSCVHLGCAFLIYFFNTF